VRRINKHTTSPAVQYTHEVYSRSNIPIVANNVPYYRQGAQTLATFQLSLHISVHVFSIALHNSENFRQFFFGGMFSALVNWSLSAVNWVTYGTWKWILRYIQKSDGAKMDGVEASLSFYFSTSLYKSKSL
jgi:hypothetical protein